MSNLLLKATGVYKTYTMGKTDVRVLRGVTVQVKQGEFLAVMGASGSGKSTLLHVLGALDTPDRGSVVFDGMDLFRATAEDRRVYCNRQVGFVFQFYHLLPELNALENVLISRMITHSSFAWLFARRQAREDCEELLVRVGLKERIKHRPKELSGGERQRVAIARALINQPRLLLADEPTGNLDAAIGGDVLALLVKLNEAGQTIVMVTHDSKVASRAHRRLQLTNGVLREQVAGKSRAESGAGVT